MKKTKLWWLLLIIPVLLFLGLPLANGEPVPNQTPQATSEPIPYQTPQARWEPIHSIELVGGIPAWWQIKSNDAYVYTTIGNQLQVLDITGSQEITQIGKYISKYSFIRIAVTKDLAFMTSVQRGLIVLDISDPSLPVLIATYPAEEHRKYSDIIIKDNIAFVQDSTDIDREKGINAATIQILDISEPSNINFITSIQDGGKPYALFGDHLYTSGYHSDDDYLSRWLNIYDISDIHNPILVSYTYSFGSVSFAARQGNYLYISSSNGLVIVDISNPIQPIQVGNYDYWVGEFVLDGDYLYYVNIGGVGVIDITNPKRPNLIADNDVIDSFPTGISLCNGYVCIGNRLEGKLYIFDTWDN